LPACKNYIGAGHATPTSRTDNGQLNKLSIKFRQSFRVKAINLRDKVKCRTASGEGYLSSATPLDPTSPFAHFGQHFPLNTLLAISSWHCLSDSCKVICYVNWAMPLGSGENGLFLISGWSWRLQAIELENMICIH